MTESSRTSSPKTSLQAIQRFKYSRGLAGLNSIASLKVKGLLGSACAHGIRLTNGINPKPGGLVNLNTREAPSKYSTMCSELIFADASEPRLLMFSQLSSRSIRHPASEATASRCRVSAEILSPDPSPARSPSCAQRSDNRFCKVARRFAWAISTAPPLIASRSFAFFPFSLRTIVTVSAIILQPATFAIVETFAAHATFRTGFIGSPSHPVS